MTGTLAEVVNVPLSVHLCCCSWFFFPHICVLGKLHYHLLFMFFVFEMFDAERDFLEFLIFD